MNNASYLLLGPETGQKNEYIDKLVKSAEKKYGEVETHSFYPYETSVYDIVDLLRNKSLFSNFKIVIIREAHAIKTAADVSAITDIITTPADNTLLILVSEQMSVSSKIKKVVKKELQKIFWEMFENKKVDWLHAFFRKHNKHVTAEAVNLILEMVPNDTTDLRNEVSKLLAFFKEKETIGEDDIEQFLYHGKEENVFTLFDQIALRDLPSALEILSALRLSSGNGAVAIVSGLVYQTRRLGEYLALIEQRYMHQEACDTLGIRRKQNRKIFQSAAGNFSHENAQRALIVLEVFDRRFRSVKTDLHAHLLMMLVYYLIKKPTADDVDLLLSGKSAV